MPASLCFFVRMALGNTHTDSKILTSHDHSIREDSEHQDVVTGNCKPEPGYSLQSDNRVCHLNHKILLSL